MDNRVIGQGRATLTRSLSNNDAEIDETNDGASSDITSATPTKVKRRPSFGIKAIMGLSRKSRSTSQLAGGTCKY